MKTREETALEFCGLVTLPHGVRVPEADAALPDALAFVGHVAEAMPDGFVRTFFAHVGDDWTDLSHAAMLVAISAKRGAP